MKIRMNVSVSGTRHDGSFWPVRGEELEVDDQEGADLCASGLAEPVAQKKPVEKATPPEPEKRSTPKKRAGRPRKQEDADKAD